MDEPRTANPLGALALGVADEMKRATPAALVTVLNYPGRGVGDYGRALGLTHSGTVRLLDRLEADGLVERRRGADGRSAAVFPTPAGRRRAEEVLAGRRRALEGALSALAASLAYGASDFVAGLSSRRASSSLSPWWGCWPSAVTSPWPTPPPPASWAW